MHRQGHRFTDRADESLEVDLVFDFSEMERPDLGGMVLVLTARQIAEDDDRTVWVRSVSAHMRELLHALGLEHLFEDFPGTPDYRD